MPSGMDSCAAGIHPALSPHEIRWIVYQQHMTLPHCRVEGQLNSTAINRLLDHCPHLTPNLIRDEVELQPDFAEVWLGEDPFSHWTEVGTKSDFISDSNSLRLLCLARGVFLTSCSCLVVVWA